MCTGAKVVRACAPHFMPDYAERGDRIKLALCKYIVAL